MLRETVEYFGRNVSARYAVGKFCAFAPAEMTVGFIDTSSASDGSRGIVFLCDTLLVNTDGRVRRANYSDITDVSVIHSFESAFEDELSVRCGGEIRISDLSLNKPFLKQLIDTLLRQYSAMTEEEREIERAECTEYALRYFSGEPPVQPEEAEELCFAGVSTAREGQSVPEENEPAPVVNSAFAEENAAPVREQSEDNAPAAADDTAQPSPEPDVPEKSGGRGSEDDFDDLDEFDDLLDEEELSGLSPEEALSLVRSSIDEINSPAAAEPPEEEIAPENKSPALTREPESDDIYICASAKLRGFCETGRLTMEEMQGALRDGLLDAADAFAQITERCEIPPQLSDKIAALKEASGGLEKYFALGEDIAVRVMFFMLYQMLSYSDRLAETEGTKERLNDFFRKWGPSGIT
ncbi:MAG: hypothetical protein ACI4XA_07505, partial [Oscillospiraceae bacterium]